MYDTHTYIIGLYNSSVRIMDLVSDTTNVVCVNFIRDWWDLQFNVDFERQIFDKLFMAVLTILRVFVWRRLTRISKHSLTSDQHATHVHIHTYLPEIC